MTDEESMLYRRVNGKATCEECGQHWYDHPRKKLYDSFTGEELWLVKACDGSLLKT